MMEFVNITALEFELTNGVLFSCYQEARKFFHIFAHLDDRNEMNSHNNGSHKLQFLVGLSQVQYCCPFI